MIRAVTKSWWYSLDWVLWFAVGALGLLFVFAPDSNLPGLVIGFLLVSLSVVATIRHWGPLIPCMFFGTMIAMLMTTPMASSHEEAVIRDLGRPLFGALLGAVFGGMWDFSRAASSIERPDDIDE